MNTDSKKQVLIVYTYPGVYGYISLLKKEFGDAIEIQVALNLSELSKALKRFNFDAILINPDMGMVEPDEVINFAKFNSEQSPFYILVEDEFFYDEQRMQKTMSDHDFLVTPTNFLNYLRKGLFGACV